MEPKQKLFLGIGIFLVVVGLLASMTQEGKKTSFSDRGTDPAAPAASPVATEQAPAPAVHPEPANPSTPVNREDKFKTGFRVDPIRGLVRDDKDGAEYFQ